MSRVKKLDPAKQKLVQMREAGSLVCVGVRDDEEGAFESGRVLVQSGVGYADHGDHGHWSYKKKPAVLDSRLGEDQGNPAHLYCTTAGSSSPTTSSAGTHGLTRRSMQRTRLGNSVRICRGSWSGGGGHITLAVVEDRFGYACWIDGGGPNMGRIDVTPVTAAAETEPAQADARQMRQPRRVHVSDGQSTGWMPSGYDLGREANLLAS